MYSTLQEEPVQPRQKYPQDIQQMNLPNEAQMRAMQSLKYLNHMKTNSTNFNWKSQIYQFLNYLLAISILLI